MRHAELFALIQAAELDRVAPDIENLARTSIRVRTREFDERRVETGGTRLGGHPDLPPRTEWPNWNGQPLCFVTQLKLSELIPYDTGHILPRTGYLMLFFGIWASGLLYAPDDPQSYRVIYWDGDFDDLVPTDHPAPGLSLPADMHVFTPCTLDFTLEWQLPEPGSWSVAMLNLSEDERTKYGSLYTSAQTASGLDEAQHRMLGYPQPLTSDGAQTGTSPECLLLQLDSDPKAQLMLPGNGRLFVYANPADVAQGRLDQVSVVLQERPNAPASA